MELPRARDRAERIALGVGGVTSVHNRLKVLAPVSTGELHLPTSP